MRIAVAGGTGLLGRLVVERLERGGDEVLVLARSAGVDLTTGAGLVDKLDGVEVVVDATNVATRRKKPAVRFFETVAQQLVDGSKRAGVGHIVAISIVGVDRVDLGYYLGKRRQEEILLGGDVPATVLRATQFHEFAAQMLAASGTLVLAPKMLCQPIAAAEVAEHLVELAHQAPRGLAPDLAGPEGHLAMDDMVKRLARLRGERRPVIKVAIPGAAGRQIAGGGLLPTGAGPRGQQTFDQWLALQRAA